MPIDRPDDPEIPSDDPPDRSRSSSKSGIQIETRSRQEYYDDLRAAVAEEVRTGKRQPADPSNTPEPKANGKPWEEVAEWSRQVWAEYQGKWPPEERSPVDRSTDPPGSWRGDSNQFLDRPDNQEMEEECDHIADQEREKFSPAMLEVESRDPDRKLVGFEYRLKGRDRIKEKVFEGMEENELSPKGALSLIPDTVRYTLQYEQARYAQGVWDDIARLTEQGFKMVRLKNFWSDEQYKGINSQWIDPESGCRFELQFHTGTSFEAKQITHDAYERLRSGQGSKLERMVLRAFQREVSAEIPVPPGATDIPDYPERKRNAR